MAMLPEVLDTGAPISAPPTPRLFGAPIPILGVAGDQQAATLGQACFTPGMLKSTYGTGCFALLNTGDAPVESRTGCSTTIAYQLDGKPTYALEGSIFIAGAVVQWLRDGLKIIKTAARPGRWRSRPTRRRIVYLVPAFTGLGAPYWDPECRGAIFGLTRGSGPAELSRAALESVGYQTRDLLEAMRADWDGAGDVQRAARRWRHDGQRLDDAVPRRHPRRAGRPAQGAGDHGAGLRPGSRGCRPGSIPASTISPRLGAGTDLHAEDGRGHARGALCRVERCCHPHAERPWLRSRAHAARRARADVLGRHA
jgi:hypothetical protein